MKGVSSIILLLATIVFAAAAEEETGNIRGLQSAALITAYKDALILSDAETKTAGDAVTVATKMIPPAVSKLALAVTILVKANTAHVALVAKLDVKNYEKSMLNLEKLSAAMMAEKLNVDVFVSGANAAMTTLIPVYEANAKARGKVATAMAEGITDETLRAAKIAANCKLVCVLEGAYEPTKEAEIPQAYALESSVKASQALIAQSEALKYKVEQLRAEMKIIYAEAAVKAAEAVRNFANDKMTDGQKVLTAAEVKFNAAKAVFAAAEAAFAVVKSTWNAADVKVSTANSNVVNLKIMPAFYEANYVAPAVAAAALKVSDAEAVGCVNNVCKRPADFVSTIQLFPVTSLMKAPVRYYPITNGYFGDQVTGTGVSAYSYYFATDRFNNPNSAYYIYGSGAILYPSASNLPTAERTIALWVKFNSLYTTATLFGYGGGACGQAINFKVSQYSAVVSDQCGGNSVTGSMTTAIVTNAWYHFAYTTSEIGGSRVFMNGKLIGSSTNFLKDTNAAGSLILGGQIASTGYGIVYSYQIPGAQDFNGYFDDIRFYNFAIPDSAVLRLYNMKP